MSDETRRTYGHLRPAPTLRLCKPESIEPDPNDLVAWQAPRVDQVIEHAAEEFWERYLEPETPHWGDLDPERQREITHIVEPIVLDALAEAVRLDLHLEAQW